MELDESWIDDGDDVDGVDGFEREVVVDGNFSKGSLILGTGVGVDTVRAAW